MKLGSSEPQNLGTNSLQISFLQDLQSVKTFQNFTSSQCANENDIKHIFTVNNFPEPYANLLELFPFAGGIKQY